MLDPLWDIKMPKKSKILNPKDHPLVHKPEELIVRPGGIVLPGIVADTPDQEFMGKIPIRTSIEVIGADKPKQLRLGWLIFEDIMFSNIKRKYKVCG